MENRILLVSKNEEDREFVKEVAVTSGSTLIEVSTCKEAETMMSGAGTDVLMVDVTTEEQFREYVHVFSSRVGKGPEQIHPRLIHLIGPEGVQRVAALTEADQFGHLLIRKYGNIKEAGQYYGRLIDSINKRNEFRIESMLGSTGGVSVIKITHSTEKPKILQKIRNFLIEEAQFSELVVDVVVNGVDEILMNAIYDAPVDDNGTQRLSHVPRDTPIALDEKSVVELQTGFDGEYIAFKVIDRFGSVDRVKLLNHLFSHYEKAAYTVNESIANAGIGLATTLRTGASLIFKSERGVKTEVTTFFKLSQSFREFRNQFKFISVHFIP